jgi:hypothetical protein
MRTLVGLLAITCLVACGDDGGKGGGDGGPNDGGGTGDGLPSDAHTDGQGADAMIDAPAGTAPLKIKNYLNWCEVQTNGAAFVRMSTQTVNVTPGDITLVARGAGTPPNSMFIVAGNM